MFIFVNFKITATRAFPHGFLVDVVTVAAVVVTVVAVVVVVWIVEDNLEVVLIAIVKHIS